MADAIFAVRLATYGETGKACIRVPRQELWRRNREKGLPDNYVMIVQDICMKEREPGQKPM